MASAEFADRHFIIDKASVEFHEVIGKGGFTDEVWSASLKLPSGDTCKVAAKKVINVQVKEIEVMKKLRHRNVITFYGVLKEPEIYILMELAENGNLRYYLDECRNKNKTRLPTEMMWKWVYEAACGIDHLHQIDYTHRDIKSLNYLITKDFTVKLGDMGLATVLDITRCTSSMRGTCRWMAPEVIKEQKRSVKSDVFSYGTVVWEICTTDIPYADKRGDFQVMNAICSGQRPVIPDDIPQELQKLIHMCWDDDYHHRPDMGAICATLEKCIQEEKSLEELSLQLKQAKIEDKAHMDTVTEQEIESKADRTKTSSIAADAEGLVFKSAEGMPLVKALSLREDLPSTEYVSPDPSLQTSDSVVAMYKMCDVPRGVCLIVNNMDFSQAREQGHKLLCDRKGSEIDSRKLQDIFTRFKFDVRIKTNLTSTEMNVWFSEVGCQDHASANAFVCCILSHGKVGQVAGCDGEYIPIYDILNNYAKEKCPSLTGKPKMFFIQACQGSEYQEKHDLATDASPSSPTGVGVRLAQIIPKEPDFLLSFATVPGHVSYRNTEKGSWYIGTLVDKMKKLCEKEDLQSILTAVNNTMSKKSTSTSGKTWGQIPLPAHTLCKKLYFTKWETVSEKQTQDTRKIDQKGGSLSLPEIGASLQIPPGAIPDDVPEVSMTLSLHQKYNEYPDIDADHLMITPVVSCLPEGIEFRQPVILTLPHSVTRFRDDDFKSGDGDNIHLWFQSSKGEWQKLPSKVPRGAYQPFWLKQITKETIILEVMHFSNFGLSANEPEDMTIMMYLHPSTITEETKAVYVSVYAVQESVAELIKKKKGPISAMCANESKLTVLPNEKKLDITLKEILPSPGWEPTKINRGISYKKLQRGNEGSRCEFVFMRKSEVNPTTIMGQYDARQEDNDDDEIKDFYFDKDMFAIASPTAAVVQKPFLPARRRLESDGEPVDLNEVVPQSISATEKIKVIGQWRDMLQKPEVRRELTPILTETMLDSFGNMKAADKQKIQRVFTNKGQTDAAELFLNKMTRLGNVWPQELMIALQNAGCNYYCRYLMDMYKKCYVEQTDRSDPQGEVVYCPPEPAQTTHKETKIEMNHLSIWCEVVHMLIGSLVMHLDVQKVLGVLDQHIHDFVTECQSEFQTRKTADGEKSAFRWLLEKLCQSGKTWPAALDMVLKEHEPLRDTVRQTFWDLHKKRWSSCPCQENKASGDDKKCLAEPDSTS